MCTCDSASYSLQSTIAVVTSPSYSTMRLILPILFSTCVLARPQSGPPSGPPAGLTSGFKSADEDTEILSIEVLEKHEVSSKDYKAIKTKVK